MRCAVFLLQIFAAFFFTGTAKAAPIPTPLSLPSLSDLFGTSSTDTDAVEPTLPVIPTATIRSSFLRPAFFARLAYCSSENVTALSCGGPCEAVLSPPPTARRRRQETGTVKILVAGGDGDSIPKFFVALDSTEGVGNEKIVVAHQGTDPGSFLSVLNDAEFILEAASNVSFPSTISFTATNDDDETESVEIHNGFQSTFDRTSSIILSTVLSALDGDEKPKKLLFTGHSLGAAVSLLDSLFIHDQLDQQGLLEGLDIQTVLFGLPRVGNTAFASLIDSLPLDLTHITNQNDPVPLLPPQFLAFTHPGNEVHINDAKGLVECPGTENKDCSAGGNVLESSIDGGIQDHLGPYFEGVSFGGKACPA